MNEGFMMEQIHDKRMPAGLVGLYNQLPCKLLFKVKAIKKLIVDLLT